MKTKQLKIIILIVSFLIANFETYAAKGPGSSPSGAISISPNQSNGGISYVAIGKQLTFTAINLVDKDDCTENDDVTDSIKDPDGIKWIIGSGTLSGGNKGKNKTWTAPTSPATSIALKLEIDDLATAENTTDDGGFKQVAVKTISVVKPNTVTMSINDIACSVVDPSTSYGKAKTIRDTLSYSGVNIDWSQLGYREAVGQLGISDGCNMGPVSTGGSEGILNSSGVDNTGMDCFAICEESDDANMYPSGCVSSSYCQWQVKAPNGSWINVFKRNYIVYGHNQGKPSQITLSVNIRSYN